MSLAQTSVQLALPQSPFPPLAVGFFGLGTGYLIYGTQELFGYPPRDERIDLATGIWGIWMPGFLQFLTGTYLFLGLTLFGTFTACVEETPSDPAAAISRLSTVYRDHLLVLAALDLAATVEDEPVVPFVVVGAQLADTADFLLAMYNQVQRRLKSEASPAPAATALFS